MGKRQSRQAQSQEEKAPEAPEAQEAPAKEAAKGYAASEEPKAPAAAAVVKGPAKVEESKLKVKPPAEENPGPIETIVMTTGGNGIQGLGVGNCLEVYSNSYQAWCPGVIGEKDASSVLVAYQVPGDPAESLINTKCLPIDTPELRVAKDDGSWLNASVEVFSGSKQMWCLGKITELQDGVATVLYFYPDAPANQGITKQLQLGTPDLQLPGAKNALQNRPLRGQDLKPGTNVDVYSNSLQRWCPGLVQDLREADGIVSVAFYYPDMDPQTEPPALKEMPIGHQDVRIAMPCPLNPNPVSEADLVAGAVVEVYSESRQFWILAHVKEVKDGLVTVLLRYPDMPQDSGLFEKVLPVGHMYIRLPAGDSDGAATAARAS